MGQGANRGGRASPRAAVTYHNPNVYFFARRHNTSSASVTHRTDVPAGKKRPRRRHVGQAAIPPGRWARTCRSTVTGLISDCVIASVNTSTKPALGDDSGERYNPFAQSVPQDAGIADEELVAQAQSGNREALEKLVCRHQAWVFNIAIRMLWRRDLAEDATQESSLRSSPSWVHLRPRANLGPGYTGSQLTIFSMFANPRSKRSYQPSRIWDER